MFKEGGKCIDRMVDTFFEAITKAENYSNKGE